MLKATPEAQKKVAEILDEQPGMVFRVGVAGGGCSGFTYTFDVGPQEADDLVVDQSGPHTIVTDHISSMYLDSATLHFKDEMFSKMFVVDNPKVKVTCGCGTSFQL